MLQKRLEELGDDEINALMQEIDREEVGSTNTSNNNRQEESNKIK